MLKEAGVGEEEEYLSHTDLTDIHVLSLSKGVTLSILLSKVSMCFLSVVHHNPGTWHLPMHFIPINNMNDY